MNGSPKSALRRSESTPAHRLALSSSSPAVTQLRKEVVIKTPSEEDYEDGENATHFKSSNIEKKVEDLLEEFFSSLDTEEVGICIKDLHSPDYHGEVVSKAISLAIEKKRKRQRRALEIIYLSTKQQCLKHRRF